MPRERERERETLKDHRFCRVSNGNRACKRIKEPKRFPKINNTILLRKFWASSLGEKTPRVENLICIKPNDKYNNNNNNPNIPSPNSRPMEFDNEAIRVLNQEVLN